MGDRIYSSAHRCPGTEFLGDRVLCCLVPQHTSSLCGCRCAVAARKAASQVKCGLLEAVMLRFELLNFYSYSVSVPQWGW